MISPSVYYKADGTIDVEGFQDGYLWIMVVASLAAAFMAYGIGANDVANSFATSVGSKALTFKAAACIGVICETLGAALLGKNVANTVRKGIIDVGFYKVNPEVLMMGFCVALFAAGFWLIICSAKGLAVSTTHSIVGAILGIGLVLNPESIQWTTMAKIIGSWFASPVLSGMLSASFFCVFRVFVLRVENGHTRALKSYPFLLLLLVASIVGTFFAKIPFVPLQNSLKLLGSGATAGIAIAVCIGIASIGALLTFRFIAWRVKRINNFASNPTVDEENQADVEQAVADIVKSEPVLPEQVSISSSSKREVESSDNGSDGEKCENDTVKLLHEKAEKFPFKTEEVYKYLLIVAACFASIAHGSNDVANAIGPFAAVYVMYTEVAVGTKQELATWIPLAGGLFISLGLVTYGYKVLMSIGMNLCKITPSRGFSIELGATWVIIIGSFLGIPLSTSHCQVGATVGVGLCESAKPWRLQGVNAKLLGRIVVSWVVTLLFTAGLSMVLLTVLLSSYFPQVQMYSCGGNLVTLQAQVNFTGTGVTPDYTDAYLREQFNVWDTNNDDLLSFDEVVDKFGNDNDGKLRALKDFDKWADNDKMTSDEWVEWRCGGTRIFTTKAKDSCTPLCEDPKLKSKGYCNPSVKNNAVEPEFKIGKCK